MLRGSAGPCSQGHCIHHIIIIIQDEFVPMQMLSFPDSPPPPPPMRVYEEDCLKHGLSSSNNGTMRPSFSGSASSGAAAATATAVSSSNDLSSSSSRCTSDCPNGVASAQDNASGMMSGASSMQPLQRRVVSLGSFAKILAPGLRIG